MGNDRQFSHVIREQWCKGCNICVALCPKNVLALSNNKVFAERPDDCIGCLLCEMRCPDFAIEVLGVRKINRDPDTTDKYFSVPPEVGV